MNSCHGRTYRITCPLCWKTTGNQWITTKVSIIEFWWLFFVCLEKFLNKHPIDRRYVMPYRSCDFILIAYAYIVRYTVIQTQKSPDSHMPTRKSRFLGVTRCNIICSPDQIIISYLRFQQNILLHHDYIIAWKRFAHHWPFVMETCRLPKYFKHTSILDENIKNINTSYPMQVRSFVFLNVCKMIIRLGPIRLGPIAIKRVSLSGDPIFCELHTL